MTDIPKKISELDAISTLAAGDLMPIVDISEASASDQNKKVLLSKLDERWRNDYQTFTQSATGAAARTYAARASDSLSVKDFGAVGDGVTDDTAAFNALLATLRGATAKRLSVIIPPGQYLVTSSINATSIRPTRPVMITAAGAEIIASCAGKAVLDCANSTNVTINGLTITASNAAVKPRIGIQIGRTATGTVASQMQFLNCKVQGWFTLTGLYSYASENLSVHRCWINAIGKPAVILDGRNYYGIASDYATVDPALANLRRSNNRHTFTECLLGLGAITGVQPQPGSHAMLMLATPDEVTLRNCYYLGYETSAIKIATCTKTDSLRALKILGHCEPDPSYLIEFIQLPTTLNGSTYATNPSLDIIEFQFSEITHRAQQAVFANNLPGTGVVNIHDAKIAIDATGRSDVYCGAKSSAATTRPNGTALEDGDLYFNTTTGLMYMRDNNAWVTPANSPMYLGEFAADPVPDDGTFRYGLLYVNTATPKSVKIWTSTQIGPDLVWSWSTAPTSGQSEFVATNLFSNDRFVVSGEIYYHDKLVTGLAIQRFHGILATRSPFASITPPISGSYTYRDLNLGTAVVIRPSLSFAGISNGNTGTSETRTLADYDEGTFETVITAATPGDFEAGISSQNCRYMKIGRLVIAQIFVTFTPTFTTASGNLQFSVPFLSLSGQRALGIVGDWDPDFTWPTTARWVTAALLGNTRQLTINYQQPGQAQNTLDMSEMTSGLQYRVGIQISYMAAS